MAMTSLGAGDLGVQDASPAGRMTWPLWGVAAGVSGVIGHLATDPQGSLSDVERQSGAEVVQVLDRAGYHVGVVAGFVAVACLLVLAVAWSRWADRRRTAGVAARVVPVALVASAGAMILGYGFKGAMAVYLPGGIDAGSYPAEGLYVLFMINDFAPYIAWQGVALAAGAVAWASLGERLVPGWVGVISALAFLAPLVFILATGLPGLAGIVGPLWLIVVFGGLALRRTGRVGGR